MLPGDAAPALREYVRGGGALVAEARLAWNDERGLASERIPGLGLSDVMGARERAVETSTGDRVRIRWTGTDLPGVAPGDLLPGRWFRETLDPLPTGHVVGEFDDGTPAAVMSVFGKGRTLLLGSYPSAAYQAAPARESERFFAALTAWAGVTRPVEVSGAPLEARHLEAGSGALLFLFNHGTTAARSEVTLRGRPGDHAVIDVTSGRPVSARHANDAVTFAVDLAPRDTLVLRIMPR
jgi:beta-galactosidase